MSLKEKYSAPTPKKMRKLGDALLACSTIISTYEIAEGNKALAITALIVGVVGKFLTNFFSEDPTDTQSPANEN